MHEPMLQCDAAAHACHLCGDIAVVGRVLTIDATCGVGQVDVAGTIANVAFDLVDTRVGDDVLVHLGFAIERVGET